MSVDDSIGIHVVADEDLHAVLEEVMKLLGESWTTKEVSSSQLHGLRQIAEQQPLAVRDFARHQKERYQRKLERTGQEGQEALQEAIRFWEVVAAVAAVEDQRRSPLAGLAERMMPEELRHARQDQKGLSRSQRRMMKEAREQYLQHWKEAWIPLFFRHLCIHLLYCKATQA